MYTIFSAILLPSHSDSGDNVQERSPMVPHVNLFRERQRRILRKQHTIADLSSRSHASPLIHDMGEELCFNACIF